MREKLQKLEGKRKKFTARFVRYGVKTFKEHQKRTILLTNVECTTDKRICCGHIWMNMTKEFAKIDFIEGDRISFMARVKKYYKGYRGHKEDIQYEKPIEKDFKLSHPTKVKLIKRMRTGYLP